MSVAHCPMCGRPFWRDDDRTFCGVRCAAAASMVSAPVEVLSIPPAEDAK